MEPRVVIVGAGVAGLCAALDLAVAGCRVTVLERAMEPGGKMRRIAVGDALIDGGPTVFTKRWVFEDLFADAGASLGDRLSLARADILARHVWDGDPEQRFDLHADADRSAEAVAQLSGPREALRFRAFLARSRAVFETLDASFMRAQRPGPVELVRRIGLSRIGDLMRIAPLRSMWSALGDHFRDPRLRQLFGRYATYCGSSPFSAPATLMLVAHVEQTGVWLVKGGMHALAHSIAGLAQARGAELRYDAHVAALSPARDGSWQLRLDTGEVLETDAVVHAGDVAALGAGLLGPDAMQSAKPVAPRERSLSAVVWSATARTSGFPLAHHNVFFSRDYAREFRELFRKRRVPSEPTVYVCAQDRDSAGARAGHGPERLQILVNAPPDGDSHAMSETEREGCETTTFALLKRCGLTLTASAEPMDMATPETFHRLFPGTGGALYGRANHGPFATFRRPGARTPMPGLYLASGSAHPGPGVPMAALSGRLAAESILTDFVSRKRLHPAAISGGMSTGSAMTGAAASR